MLVPRSRSKPVDNCFRPLICGLTAFSEPNVSSFRTTGELLPVTKWPTSATVYEFLKTNPDCGIHSSSVTPEVKTAAGCYANRLGNEPAEGTSSSTPTPATPSATPSTAAKASTSSSSAAAQQKELEQVQQMLIQQATLQQLMMQQAMLGMSPYGSVLPGSSSSSKVRLRPLFLRDSHDTVVFEFFIQPSYAQGCPVSIFAISGGRQTIQGNLAPILNISSS